MDGVIKMSVELGAIQSFLQLDSISPVAGHRGGSDQGSTELEFARRSYWEQVSKVENPHYWVENPILTGS